MHKATAPAPVQVTAPSSSSSACPYVPPDSSPNSTTATTATPAHQSNSSSSTLSKLNPLNYMPSNISNKRATSQSVHLPLERETSSIPKGDGTGANWEYPSPQQMYNAMLRKGYTDTDETAVEAMVSVHNFLNEGAWAEIMEWESEAEEEEESESVEEEPYESSGASSSSYDSDAWSSGDESP